jgi:hypothetical protein
MSDPTYVLGHSDFKLERLARGGMRASIAQRLLRQQGCRHA